MCCAFEARQAEGKCRTARRLLRRMRPLLEPDAERRAAQLAPELPLRPPCWHRAGLGLMFASCCSPLNFLAKLMCTLEFALVSALSLFSLFLLLLLLPFFFFPYKLFCEFYLCLVCFLSDRGPSGGLHFELLLLSAYETK